jgi:hypothetical protein
LSKVSAGSDDTGVRGPYPPLLVRNSDLTAVVFRCSDGDQKDAWPSNLFCRQTKVINVLGAAIDLERGSRPDFKTHGVFQDRGAETIEERLLEVGQTHGIMKFFRTGAVRTEKAERSFFIFDLPMLP